MNIYVQKTIRIDHKKAELLDLIRKEKGMSWNAIVDSALDGYLEKHTVPAKVNNTEPKIALLSEKKQEESGQESGDNGLDMKILGDTNGNTF